MGRDKAKDDDLFNCSQEHEADYVAGLYPDHEQTVREFLQKQCLAGNIKNSKHIDVYRLIKEKLGLPIPPVKLKTINKPSPSK